MNSATLIYDGECGLCRRAVDWVDLNTVPGSVELLPCQDATRPERFPAISTDDCLTAMQLVEEGGTVYTGERAIPRILARSYRRRWRLLGLLFRVPGAYWAAKPVYALIARNRTALSSFLITKKPAAGKACGIERDCD